MNNLHLWAWIMDISMLGKCTLLVDKSKLSIGRGYTTTILPSILSVTEINHEVVWGVFYWFSWPVWDYGYPPIIINMLTHYCKRISPPGLRTLARSKIADGIWSCFMAASDELTFYVIFLGECVVSDAFYILRQLNLPNNTLLNKLLPEGNEVVDFDVFHLSVRV